MSYMAEKLVMAAGTSTKDGHLSHRTEQTKNMYCDSVWRSNQPFIQTPPSGADNSSLDGRDVRCSTAAGAIDQNEA